MGESQSKLSTAKDKVASVVLPGGGAMGALMRTHDWSTSPVGDPSSWPQSLRSIVETMLANKHLMFVAWGPELAFLYNDGYAPVFGAKHPWALGRPFREVWPEIWDDLEPLVSQALSGEATWSENLHLVMERNGYPEDCWFTFSYSPVRDESGRVAGIFCAGTETTAKVLAERRLRESEERLQLALSAGRGIGTWDWDVPNDRVAADERFARLYGVDPDHAAAGAPIVEFFGNVHPDDLPGLREAIAAALRTGEVFSAEYRLLQADGSVRWAVAEGRCTLAPDNTPLRFPGVTFDITDRKEAEERLRDSEARHRFALQAGKLGWWDLDLRDWTLTTSDHCKTNFGRKPNEPFTYEDLREAIHPEDRDRMATTVERSVATGEDYDIEYRAIWPSGEERWMQIRGRPDYAPGNTPLRMAGVSLDVTERRQAEERQALLVRELHHRVKNNLATVQSIINFTLRTTDSMEAFQKGIGNRITSLARSHSLLMDNDWQGAPLREILCAELDPHDDGQRLTLQGPVLHVPADAAVPLAMAVHELTTNALKYGALSVPEGRLDVRWTTETMEDGQQLRLDWIESGGPPVAPPSRRGFGSTLIEKLLGSQLGGKVDVAYLPEGVRVHIEAYVQKS